ncbi:MAG TPA: sulfatase [Gaiellales bacterium]|nr:sulfatase [Gaiellales bacterium]
MSLRMLYRALRVPLGLIAFGLLMSAQAAGNTVTRAVTASRPNVLVILTDDQRYEGTGGPEGFLNFMTNVRTWMQQGGENFTNMFVTSSLCSPSRGALMTGRYAHNTGVLINGDQSPVQVFNQQTSLQYRLQQAGYLTGLAGKYFNTWPIGMTPPYFNEFALTKGGYNNTQFNVNGTTAVRSGYTVSVTQKYALQFLQDFHTQDPTRPWYMYVALEAPHSPYTADTPYKNATFPAWNGNPAVAEKDKSDKPPVVQRNGTNGLAAGNQRRIAQDRTLLSVNDMVGALMNYLQSSGQLDNTLVIYTSDNGMMWGEHGLLDKRYPYAPSVHVPLFVRWPGHVTAGSTSSNMVANIDIAPTILDATGTSFDPSQIDGHDLLGPYVRSRMHLEYWVSPDAPGVPTWRGTWTNNYEYVQWYGPKGGITFREYYNLQNDPYQLTNLLHDGTTANDPKTAPLQAQVNADQACAGASCP